MMVRLTLSFALFAIVLLHAQMQTRQKVIMGTFVSLSVDEKDKAFLQPAFRIIKEIDASLSSYKKNSVIYKLNQNKQAKLDVYSYEALGLAKKYFKDTKGYFNAAIGHITKDLYRFGLDERDVSKAALEKSYTNLNDLHFDKNKANISQDMKIDLGGMGKGFAVDKVYDFLKSTKVDKAVIALSGDIRCRGECKIDVKNPLKEGSVLASFTMNESGVSTSGNYNRYINTPKTNHLINPKSKMPQQGFISVTLISKLPSATLDAYATAVSTMPQKEALIFLQKQKLTYILLTTKEELFVSKNIDKFVENLSVNDTFKKQSKE
jgi:thiamine biosynthesis lipoprotein